jgi:putative transposase
MASGGFHSFLLFVVLHHGRRHVVHFAVTEHPEVPGVIEQLREAFPFLTAPHYAILDRDGKYGYSVSEALRSMGVKPVRSAPRSLWPNPYGERFGGCVMSKTAFRSCQRELLDMAA